MEEETASMPSRETLCAQLDTVDQSIGFLLLIIAATLLSVWSVFLQRRQLCLTIQGKSEETGALPPLYPIRHRASAIIVGSLGFFLCLAMNSWESARMGEDCVAKRSSLTNLWASLFVLVASILRYRDLDFVTRCQQSLVSDDTLPD